MIPIAEPDIQAPERRRIQRVLESGQLASGPEVTAFEDEFAAVCDVPEAVATANGTAALHAALVALGIGPGDTVLTTPFSFIASANAARLAGADVMFADIDPRTFNIDPGAIENLLRTGVSVDAVIAVHLFGLPADMNRLLELQDKYGYLLIEDAAQAHGATVDGQPVGSFGDVGCFSFYPTKNVIAGEGGMITTASPEVAARARRFIDHGRTAPYEHQEVGHNLRMSSLHAAIGRVQLERLEAVTADRRHNATELTERLSPLGIETPVEPPGRNHVYHQYTIRHPDRDRLRESLASQGIQTGIYYPIPIHQQPAYDWCTARFEHAERAAQRVLSLPVHPRVTEADIEHIHHALRNTIEVVQ